MYKLKPSSILFSILRKNEIMQTLIPPRQASNKEQVDDRPMPIPMTTWGIMHVRYFDFNIVHSWCSNIKVFLGRGQFRGTLMWLNSGRHDAHLELEYLKVFQDQQDFSEHQYLCVNLSYFVCQQFKYLQLITSNMQECSDFDNPSFYWKWQQINRSEIRQPKYWSNPSVGLSNKSLLIPFPGPPGFKSWY